MEKSTSIHTIIRILLKELRLERQVQQAQIGVLLGKSASVWSKVESGESELSLDHLVTGCTACQAWPSDLLQTAQNYMTLLQQYGWFVASHGSALPKSEDLLSIAADEYYSFVAKNRSPVPTFSRYQVLQTPWPWPQHYAPLDVFRWATDDVWKTTLLSPQIPPPPPPAPLPSFPPGDF